MSDETSIPQRRCTKCGEEFPATLEHFHKQKNGKFGLSSWCITCHREVNNRNKRIWNKENAEYVSEYGKQYRTDNHEQIASYNKDYYWSNVERERTRVKENKQRFRPRNNKRRRERYQERKHILRPKASATRAHKMATDPEYRARVKIQAKRGKAKRRALEANAIGTHTAADIRAIHEEQQDLCAYCGIRLHGDYHLDHIHPISKGGTNWPDNLCLTCSDCNLTKHDKMPDEWAATRGW